MRRGCTGRGGRAGWGAVVLVLAAAWACGGDGERDGRARRSRHAAGVGAHVISTVDGEPITLSEVQDLVSHSELSPDEALRRLQAERLLMIEAERRRLSHAPAVEWVARQARVQALLDAVTSAAAVSDEEVRAAYDENRARFEHGERRVAVHVLARLPKQPTPEADAAARAFAAEMIGPLGQAADPQKFVSRMPRAPMPHFSVVAEQLPPIGRDGGLVEPFLSAMFSLSQPGVVPEPIKTIYGWHAIRVIEIQPALSTPYADAAEQLRGELLLERQKQLVAELIEAARKANRVELRPDLRQKLAKLEL